MNFPVYTLISVTYQEAALRCKKDFSEFVGDRDELLKHMLDWALGGFQPTGPDGLKPTDVPNGTNTCFRKSLNRFTQ